MDLTRHSTGTPLAEYLRQEPALCSSSVATIINKITDACVGISDAVRKGGLGGLLGSAGTSNIQGEVQQTLDVFANTAIVAACRDCLQ